MPGAAGRRARRGVRFLFSVMKSVLKLILMIVHDIASSSKTTELYTFKECLRCYVTYIWIRPLKTNKPKKPTTTKTPKTLHWLWP